MIPVWLCLGSLSLGLPSAVLSVLVPLKCTCMPVWLWLGSLSLGLPSVVLSVLVPLKCTCMPFFLHSFLNFSPVLGM